MDTDGIIIDKTLRKTTDGRGREGTILPHEPSFIRGRIKILAVPSTQSALQTHQISIETCPLNVLFHQSVENGSLQGIGGAGNRRDKL